MENLWTPYRDGRVQVDLTVVDRQALPWQQRLQEIFGAGADARLYEQRFIMMGFRNTRASVIATCSACHKGVLAAP